MSICSQQWEVSIWQWGRTFFAILNLIFVFCSMWTCICISQKTPDSNTTNIKIIIFTDCNVRLLLLQHNNIRSTKYYKEHEILWIKYDKRRAEVYFEFSYSFGGLLWIFLSSCYFTCKVIIYFVSSSYLYLCFQFQLGWELGRPKAKPNLKIRFRFGFSYGVFDFLYGVHGKNASPSVTNKT